MPAPAPLVLPLSGVSLADAPRVGGKNASLGELIRNLAQAGVRVPDGFATTTDAFRQFLRANQLADIVRDAVRNLNPEDLRALAQTGADIRRRILDAKIPPDLEDEIRKRYRRLCESAKAGSESSPVPDDIPVAVRSSATAEDAADSSFAGQQETFLNIRGEAQTLEAVRHVFASLYTDRAISYRKLRGYDDHDALALSAGVQRMVRSQCAGVMFTLDTESGFEKVVFVTAAYGLGESVVQGNVNPDEFYVYKPALDAGRPAIIRRRLGDKAEKMIFADDARVGASVRVVNVENADRRKFCVSDDDIAELARCARLIEKHYGRHMDIEWGRDETDGRVYILQARPETVRSAKKSAATLTRYRPVKSGTALAEGRAIGRKIGIGTARVVASPDEMHSLKDGEVLIADMTDPDWEPVMKRAGAIATRRGGRTCHAAIIARELGVPAVVGCGDSLDAVADGELVSVSCAEGDTGKIYQGAMEFAVDEIALDDAPKLRVKLQVNVANPDLAFEFARLPADGVGLARLEFVIARNVGFHPRCALEYAGLPEDLRREVRRLSAGYADPRSCYVEKIAESAATIAAAFHPRPVIVRLSDFKSNEYAGLVGGRRFEPVEENPMLGFRGAARYVSESFSPCLQMECEALVRAREFGLDNIWVMVPFVRTLREADATLAKLAEFGIARAGSVPVPDSGSDSGSNSGEGGKGKKIGTDSGVGTDGRDERNERGGTNGVGGSGGGWEWTIVMMCEVPSNALLAEEFLERFDGFSIGSNDLTQMTLGLDRDSGLVAAGFDERDAAVKMMIARAIAACRKAGKYVGICGQAPSDHPDLAKWLVEAGVSAMSLNPDSVAETRMLLAGD